MYKPNPKTEGSGLISCIPQKGECSNKCTDCFYNSGRSYLQPLQYNTPNIPPRNIAKGRIVRVNDGNDSNIDRNLVEQVADRYDDYFFNTSIPNNLETFPGPVVLTINPGKMTDRCYYVLEYPPENLMFVRIRTNIWNIETVVKPAVEFYTRQTESTASGTVTYKQERVGRQIPVVLTYMAYYEDERAKKSYDYIWQKRILNNYWVISNRARKQIESMFEDNPYVYTCGYKGTHSCKQCGNCLREYYRVKEVLKWK